MTAGATGCPPLLVHSLGPKFSECKSIPHPVPAGQEVMYPITIDLGNAGIICSLDLGNDKRVLLLLLFFLDP
jgi:hypothetical protein